MTTRMQRAFDVTSEPKGERKVTEQPAAKPESKGGGKGDPYPTLPRRSLIRDKRPGE